jgi:hypothetical protein
VVAPPALTRALWVTVAVVAAAVLAVLATHGRRPDPSLARFEPAGVMVQIPPERIAEVTLSRDGRRWRFARADGGAWAAAGAPLDADVAVQVERGLRFLHVSAPQRVLRPTELSGTSLAELGLDPPRYLVAVGSATGPAFTVEFGALNAQGLAQYARLRGHDEILLLPAFVGEPWDVIARSPAPPR